ncbi:S8 family peptidase [Demequina aurantiaca]|uniref:S8 family peptidase n=1 Tax=Demequina aurantiaca TaxID=676200 RepID=UPI003D33C2C6
MKLRIAAVGVVVALVAVAVGLPAAAATNDDGQWYLDVYGIPDFHAEGIDGSGVTIAVLDDGINLDAPALQGADVTVHEPAYCYSPEGVSRPAQSDDVDAAWHGTNVTSMIVGNGNSDTDAPGVQGVAPGASILFYAVGGDRVCYTEDGGSSLQGVLGPAISQAVDDGADIISVSFITDEDVEKDILKALRAGVIVVAGLSNQDTGDSIQDTDGAPVIYNGVLGVGAFGPTGEVITDYTGNPNTSQFVDVVAPGDVILTQGHKGDTWAGTELSSGTSFATPITAANLALAVQKYPQATSNQLIQSLIRNTGVEPHELMWDDINGYGSVDTISFLASDPTQYEDINPLLVELTGDVFIGPSIEQVLGSPSAAPTTSTSPSPSGNATEPAPSPTPLPDSLGASNTTMVIIAIAVLVALALIATVVIVIVISKNRKQSPTP